jgi:hypothetical protein
VPGGSDDRGGAGERLEGAGVGETSTVVAELAEHAGTGRVGQAREQGDDRVVGMLRERLRGGGGELVDAVVLGVQGGQQS